MQCKVWAVEPAIASRELGVRVDSSDFAALRRDMVARQIVRRGVRSAPVLAAMGRVPREVFVPDHLRHLAYVDGPLPIECGQTISQPYIVALMTEALELRGTETVLEIGTGSGYAAAVLACVAAQVHTVERVDALADAAALRLAELGHANVQIHCGDGTLGWPAHAPYGAIVVTAGGPQVPPALQAQLAIGARLVIPVGRDHECQELLRVTRRSDQEFDTECLTMVSFVPLLGAQGW